MRDNPYYVFFGFASEYVLHPLYCHMQKEGLNCIEIDLFTTPDARNIIQSLKNKPVVFVNSAHLFFDKENFSTSYQYQGEVFSALEVIDYLKPLKSVYIPHDLSQLFHEKELAWLTLFDSLLIPRARPAYLHSHPHVMNVGWIKRSQPVLPVTQEISSSFGFAFCDYEYHRRLGAPQTFQYWQPILASGVPIKLPHWQETDQFEAYFREAGACVYKSTESLSDFIDQHGIILCNGSSSVNSEAAYSGRKVINILYNHYTENDQKRALGPLPNIDYLTIEACANYIREVQHGQSSLNIAALTPPQIKPFDFVGVTKLLTQI